VLFPHSLQVVYCCVTQQYLKVSSFFLLSCSAKFGHSSPYISMVYTTFGSHHHKYIIRRSAYVIIVVYSNLIAINNGEGRRVQHQLQLISEIVRRKINPLYGGGGGKDSIITTRSDRTSIYTVEAPYNKTYHPQRGSSRRRSCRMMLLVVV